MQNTKQSSEGKIELSPEESLRKLEKDLELLSKRIKTLAKKNGFSPELKKRVALELR